MLKGIPKVISPELLKVLAEMGHGDEIVIADANFPAASVAKRLIRADGIGGVEMLKSILEIFPLDTYADPVFLMEKVKGDTVETPIWEEYKTVVKKHSDSGINFIERFNFYERAKEAYAVVITGEEALYANVLLKKGVIK